MVLARKKGKSINNSTVYKNFLPPLFKQGSSISITVVIFPIAQKNDIHKISAINELSLSIIS